MAEIIREKALNNLNDEVPHGIAVTIEQLNERENRNSEAMTFPLLFTARESHTRAYLLEKVALCLER